MTFPLINHIYEFNNEKVVIWQQTLFSKVFLRTLTDSGGSSYYTVNWFNFLLNAKHDKELQEVNKNY